MEDAPLLHRCRVRKGKDVADQSKPAQSEKNELGIATGFGAISSSCSFAALAAGWLVHAPRLPGAAGRQVTGAGVGAVVDTGTAIAGTTPATALGVLVAMPAALSGACSSRGRPARRAPRAA